MNRQQQLERLIESYEIPEQNLELLDFRGTVTAATRKEATAVGFVVRREIHDYAKNIGKRGTKKGFWFQLTPDQLKAVQERITKVCEEYSEELPRNDDEYDEITNTLDNMKLQA